MARKLKTFITNLGFFELALAAPSMKAALEAWGMGHNAFHQGFAKETHDAKIVAATMAKPGVVLRRPVGTRGAFSEDAELPKQVWKLTPAKNEPPAVKTKAVRKRPTQRHDDQRDRAAILSFAKAKERRDRERTKADARNEAQRAKEQLRIERAAAKADKAMERARQSHESKIAAIEKALGRLDHQRATEMDRWNAELAKLKAARAVD